MVRASLPVAGVAAALLVASVAVGQAPQFSADPPVLYLSPAWPETAWQPQAQWHHPLLDMMETDGVQLVSFEAADDDGPRLKPMPKETKEPAAAGACPVEVVEEGFGCPCFESPCYVPVPYFLPSPYQGGCGHKCCHRNKRGGCHGGGCNQGGYGPGYGGGPGYGSAYGGWGYGMGGWDCGMGCGGFYPPYPPQQQGCCSGHKCHRNKQGCGHGGQACPRCGYPGGGPGYGGGGYGWGGGYPGGWAYPVAGWSTMNDGLNGFTDPNCFGCGKQGCCHGGLFHRKCHQQQAPAPYPCWPMPQPCCGMDGFGSF